RSGRCSSAGGARPSAATIRWACSARTRKRASRRIAASRSFWYPTDRTGRDGGYSRMTRIAFLGLGLMGRPMAANLVKAGHELTVWNRSPGKAGDLPAAGAREARTPLEAVAGAEAVFTMLSDGKAV